MPWLTMHKIGSFRMLNTKPHRHNICHMCNMYTILLCVVFSAYLVLLTYWCRWQNGALPMLQTTNIGLLDSNTKMAAFNPTRYSPGSTAKPANTQPKHSAKTSSSSKPIKLLHEIPTKKKSRTDNSSSAAKLANNSVPKKPFLLHVSGKGGRLGNMLFQYAACYGIARMNNRSAVIHLHNSDKMWDVFANLSIPRGKLPPNVKTISEKGYATYNRKFEKLPEVNVGLRGFFQSWKYFQNYERELRTEFTLNNELRKLASDRLVRIAQMYNKNSAVPKQNITFVGVHVRRGDTVRIPAFRVASKSYILRAMHDFRRNFTRVHFVVCSDDIRWCKQNLGHKKNVSFSESKSAKVDFAILSLCNHTLSTIGSFSWWVGWMAGGVTTYYAPFVEKWSHQYLQLTVGDHFLPNWIPMSD